MRAYLQLPASAVLCGLAFFLAACFVPDFGRNDLIEYWSALRILQNGENIYNPYAMHAVQQSTGYMASSPLMMWNPPWTPLLMYPGIAFGFETSRLVCSGLNGALLAVTTWLIFQVLEPRNLTFPKTLLLSLLFVPVLVNAQIGQLGMLQAFALAGIWWSVSRSTPIFTGMFLALSFVKPHIFIILYVALLFNTDRSTLARYAIGFLTSIICLELLVYTFSPSSFRAWPLYVWDSSTTIVASPLEWRTATISSTLRSLFEKGDQTPIWPMVYLPGISLIAVSYLCVRRFIDIRENFGFLFVVAISFIAAPFGWFFDQAGLLPLFIDGCDQAAATRSRSSLLGFFRILNGFLVLQIFTLLFSNYIHFQHQYWWYPLPLAGLWLVSRKRDVDNLLPRS